MNTQYNKNQFGPFAENATVCVRLVVRMLCDTAQALYVTAYAVVVDLFAIEFDPNCSVSGNERFENTFLIL